MLIMMIVCFLVPFALRGSKMVTQRMENDIKDWLPGDFPETRELEWFGKLFLGEQFIVITWEGCSEEDPSYQLFVDKLKAELVIPEGGRPWGESADRERQQQLEEAEERSQIAEANMVRMRGGTPADRLAELRNEYGRFMSPFQIPMAKLYQIINR